MQITKEVVQKCHNLSYKTLPEAVVDRVQYLLLDYIGVAARGSLSESSRPVQRVISSLENTQDGAVVIGTNIKATPPLCCACKRHRISFSGAG